METADSHPSKFAAPRPPPHVGDDPGATARDAPENVTLHRGRVVGPLPYRTRGGRAQHVPVGPCLVECCAAQATAIVWGDRGQHSAALPFGALDAAQDQGHLILLD